MAGRSDKVLERAEADGTPWPAAIDALVAAWQDQVGARRQGRSRKREEDILAAALRVFARDGIARARIADIAVEAAIPLSSLYEYYPSKEDIAYAVPVAQLARFLAGYAALSREAATVRERLRLFLWFSADFARRNPDWARTLYLEIWPSVAVGSSLAREPLDEYGRVVVSLIRIGARRGEWAEADPYETASILIGSHNQLVITWLLYRQPHDILQAVTSMVDRLLAAVLPAPHRAARRPRRTAHTAVAPRNDAP